MMLQWDVSNGVRLIHVLNIRKTDKNENNNIISSAFSEWTSALVTIIYCRCVADRGLVTRTHKKRSSAQWRETRGSEWRCQTPPSSSRRRSFKTFPRRKQCCRNDARIGQLSPIKQTHRMHTHMSCHCLTIKVIEYMYLHVHVHSEWDL